MWPYKKETDKKGLLLLFLTLVGLLEKRGG
jgi:hypothetical protein